MEMYFVNRNTPPFLQLSLVRGFRYDSIAKLEDSFLCQILSMVFATLIIASVGVGLYPSTGFGRGRLLQAALLLWSLMGMFGGYTAARFYKLFQVCRNRLHVASIVVNVVVIDSIVVILHLISCVMVAVPQLENDDY